MKKGDKFFDKIVQRTFTAASFYGPSGIEFDTPEAAVENNPELKIENVTVGNVEHGGASIYKYCEKV